MAPRKQKRLVREPVSLYEAKTHLSDLVEQAAQRRSRAKSFSRSASHTRAKTSMTSSGSPL